MTDDDKEPKMSDEQRRLAEHTAELVIERLFRALQSEELADKVLDTWGGKVDRIIGRGLRRLGLYVVIGLIGIASMKVGLSDWLISFLKK